MWWVGQQPDYEIGGHGRCHFASVRSLGKCRLHAGISPDAPPYTFVTVAMPLVCVGEQPLGEVLQVDGHCVPFVSCWTMMVVAGL